jgi:hypothetical protein
MKLSELLEEANRTEDARAIECVLNRLRFVAGMNYAESRTWCVARGITADRFEELCQIADQAH